MAVVLTLLFAVASGWACEFDALVAHPAPVVLILDYSQISTEALRDHAVGVMSDSQLNRVESMGPKRAREFLAGRAALAALAQSQGLDGTVEPHPQHGYPVWVAADGHPRFISLAHSRGFAVATLAEKPVGVDLEHRSREASRAIGRYADTTERDLFNERFGTGGPIHLWGAKEALGKATGLGLFQALKENPVVVKGDDLVLTSELSGPQSLVSPGVTYRYVGDMLVTVAGDSGALTDLVIEEKSSLPVR